MRDGPDFGNGLISGQFKYRKYGKNRTNTGYPISQITNVKFTELRIPTELNIRPGDTGYPVITIQPLLDVPAEEHV